MEKIKNEELLLVKGGNFISNLFISLISLAGVLNFLKRRYS